MRDVLVICLILAGICLVLHASPSPYKLAQSAPETLGLLSSQLSLIDGAAEAAIGAGELPGAVVLVGRHGQIGYCKAFGRRSIQPNPESMTEDTIFDLASLTKVAATAPSIMMLVEKGSLRLEDKVKRYLPNFTGGGKDAITLSQLLTHYSGLPPDFDLSKEWSGSQAALEELWKIPVAAEPGKEFIYSDLNFIALGEIVRAVSGKTLDVFSREFIFSPLGMSETFFNPPASLAGRIAPTESRKNSLRYLKGHASIAGMDQMLRGEVHDPTAWRMGGVAGHAGLFSSAGDLAIFVQMLLNRGAYPGGRILSPAAVQAMTSPESPRNALQVRGYGWDIDSKYSSPRGDLFKDGYGHTGFSGTSIWIYPPSDIFVIILSSRLHPEGGKEINHFRAAIANIAAAAITESR